MLDGLDVALTAERSDPFRLGREVGWVMVDRHDHRNPVRGEDREVLFQIREPRSSAARSGEPEASSLAPPWYRRLATVTTRTAASTEIPTIGATMSMNFSAPSSVANPASTVAYSAQLRASSIARRLAVPCAMLANGPA